MAASAMPLVPNGLAYPELVPESLHDRCLHDHTSSLAQNLRWAVANSAERQAIGLEAANAVRRFGWPTVAAAYDRTLEDLVNA